MNINSIVWIAILLFVIGIIGLLLTLHFESIILCFLTVTCYVLFGCFSIKFYTWNAPLISTKEFPVEVKKYSQCDGYYYIDKGIKKEVSDAIIKKTNKSPYVVIEHYEEGRFWDEKIYLYLNE